MPTTILLVATTNQGKLREIRDILSDIPFDLRALDPDGTIEPPDETGATFEENARLKARYYAQATGLLTVADDSGIEIDALDRRPGVHSARYPGADYPERFRNLWREICASGRPERTARFVCAVALAAPGGVLYETRGVIEGEVIEEPRGTGGFGYDPIFFYPPFGATLAEIDQGRKSEVSHRGAAFRALRQYLLDHAERQR